MLCLECNLKEVVKTNLLRSTNADERINDDVFVQTEKFSAVHVLSTTTNSLIS